MLLNFYPIHKNEVSFIFIKFNVAIKLQVFLHFLYYLKATKLAETCCNELLTKHVKVQSMTEPLTKLTCKRLSHNQRWRPYLNVISG